MAASGSDHEHRVGLVLDARGERAADALDRLRVGLGDSVSEPDEAGAFDVSVAAPSFDAALTSVWNAVAAAGLDDQLRFTERPDIPEHWRARGSTG
jgi:hypothetical protein